MGDDRVFHAERPSSSAWKQAQGTDKRNASQQDGNQQRDTLTTGVLSDTRGIRHQHLSLLADRRRGVKPPAGSTGSALPLRRRTVYPRGPRGLQVGVTRHRVAARDAEAIRAGEGLTTCTTCGSPIIVRASCTCWTFVETHGHCWCMTTSQSVRVIVHFKDLLLLSC